MEIKTYPLMFYDLDKLEKKILLINEEILIGPQHKTLPLLAYIRVSCGNLRCEAKLDVSHNIRADSYVNRDAIRIAFVVCIYKSLF